MLTTGRGPHHRPDGRTWAHPRPVTGANKGDAGPRSSRFRAGSGRGSRRLPRPRARTSRSSSASGRCARVSRRETTLLVLGILSATSCCVMPAAARAATRSVTSTCNVRSASRARPRRARRRSCERNCSTFRASTRSGSCIGVFSFVGQLAKMLTRTRMHAYRPCGRTWTRSGAIARAFEYGRGSAILLTRSESSTPRGSVWLCARQIAPAFTPPGTTKSLR